MNRDAAEQAIAENAEGITQVIPSASAKLMDIIKPFLSRIRGIHMAYLR